MRHLKKLSEEVIHQNFWWKYKHDQYKKLNGQISDYYYGETRGQVMIVPILQDGRLMLILQPRYLADKQSIEFPGGSIEEKEETVVAAQRKLIDETGYRAKEFIHIGNFEPANRFVKDTCHIFLGQVTDRLPEIRNNTEEIEVLYRWSHEFEEMIRRNEIWDGQTLAAWALVHDYIDRIKDDKN